MCVRRVLLRRNLRTQPSFVAFGFPSVLLSPIALFTTVICVINVWLISEARALFGRAQLHILGLMR